MSFFSRLRSRARPGYAGNHFRPNLEALESRDCPSTLSVTAVAPRTVSLTGQLTVSNPGSRTIYFTGVCGGTTVTNSDGTFSATVHPYALGNVQACIYTDNDPSHLTAMAQALVMDTAPIVIHYQGAGSGYDIYTFTGIVMTQFAPGMTVTFSGANITGQTSTVDNNCAFTFTTVIMSGYSGLIGATATDWWSLNSETVYVYVSAA